MHQNKYIYTRNIHKSIKVYPSVLYRLTISKIEKKKGKKLGSYFKRTPIKSTMCNNFFWILNKNLNKEEKMYNA